MSLEDLGNIGEFVAAIAVVVSLLYLAVQIRGDARAKRGATIHAQTQASAGFLNILVASPDVAELYFRGVHDFAPLQGAELIRFSSLMMHMFRLYEDQFLQWTEGDLDPKVWNLEAPLDDLLALPGVRAWWATRAHWFRPQFQLLVQDKLSEQRTPTIYGESPA